VPKLDKMVKDRLHQETAKLDWVSEEATTIFKSAHSVAWLWNERSARNFWLL
jgi:hypothetical protein